MLKKIAAVLLLATTTAFAAPCEPERVQITNAIIDSLEQGGREQVVSVEYFSVAIINVAIRRVRQGVNPKTTIIDNVATSRWVYKGNLERIEIFNDFE